MRRALILGAVLGLTGAVIVLPERVLSSPATSPAVLYTVAREYDPAAWMHGGERFPQGAFIHIAGEEKGRPWVRGFAASADANVSFDGARVLFAGKQKVSGTWQIWEASADGSGPRRVTFCYGDCVSPFYVPDERIAYAHKINGHFVLEIVPIAGGKPLQLTYGPNNSLPSDILLDGRVLFETALPGKSAGAEIYTVYTDGSGVESYRCDHARSRYAARQVASGDIVFTIGPGLARFTSALAHEVSIAAPAGEYAGDLAETPDGEWLLAWRADPQSGFALKRWKPGTASLEPIAALEGASAVQPVLVAGRPTPKINPTGLHDWANANLLCLNSYTSKYKFADGSVRKLRMYTRGPSGQAKLLGSASVENDGSFFVQVPGERPLQIELLDASGKTLKREAGWFWMRRGEQRACVGCHAGPETSPENAVPMALLRSTTPVDMTGAGPSRHAS